MLKITLPDGSLREVAEGSTLLPLAREYAAAMAAPIVCSTFNGELFDLQKPLQEDGRVSFVTLQEEDGMHTYVRTLLFLFLAVARVYKPQVRVDVDNALGDALYCHYQTEQHFSEADLVEITAKMQELVQQQTPIKLIRIPAVQALEEYGPRCGEDFRGLVGDLEPSTLINIYVLNERTGYFFGPMCPHVGLVPVFKLFNYDGGLVIHYPAVGNWQELGHFQDIAKLNNAYHDAEAWSARIKCNTVSKMNAYIKAGVADKIIQMGEAFQERKIARIADQIAEQRNELKLVLIAGPSSSGKTSFAQRLSIQLAVNGIRPITVSMDDYYKNRAETPRKANGDYDFECLEALDLELFNEHLTRLLKGERVRMPKFNFKAGLREYHGKELQVTDNSVLLVEGIHGLNDKLTASIPANKKLKIYISALTPMSFDQYNRISTTDTRLLRRMVRDSKFRAFDAQTTLAKWTDVREGEDKYIFPYQGNADVVMNTSLIYELAVIKKYAEPLLLAVPQEAGPAYTKARKLLKILRHVHSLADDVIPNNSLLKEFLGGSVFKDAL